MSQDQALEAVLEPQDALKAGLLKCGCCGKSMKPFQDGELRPVAEMFRRPCSCHTQHNCFICGYCLMDCKCGQRFWVD